ncbi:MAG: hypothetical protein COC01_03805 [Bacteroidetes bacterium]|nr:MAG: hypothetical protein COC01_03805 [Bacteroidota bacterium]
MIRLDAIDTLKNYKKSAEELKEEARIILLAQKDHRYFERLYNDYFRDLFLFVYKRTGNEDLADDITSQVFLKALLNLKKYQFRGVPFSAWLFRIAINEINMYFRKLKAAKTITIDKVSMHNMMEICESEDKDENHTFLFKALNSLSPAAMELINLRFFENRSFKEIGEILNITENNSKVRTYRIIDKLRKMLKSK